MTAERGRKRAIERMKEKKKHEGEEREREIGRLTDIERQKN